MNQAVRCPPTCASCLSRSHRLYDHGHIIFVECSYVALPKFPINQNAGHKPLTSLLPGKRSRTSTTPPEKQNLFHELTMPPLNSFSKISYFLVKGLKPFHLVASLVVVMFR